MRYYDSSFFVENGDIEPHFDRQSDKVIVFHLNSSKSSHNRPSITIFLDPKGASKLVQTIVEKYLSLLESEFFPEEKQDD